MLAKQLRILKQKGVWQNGCYKMKNNAVGADSISAPMLIFREA